MKKLMLILAVIIVSMSVTSAFAKDLCVVDNLGHTLKFDGIKLLKGKSTPLVGRLHIGGGVGNGPISGVVTLDSDNETTRIAVTYYGISLGEVVLLYLTGDKFFNAAGRYDIVPFVYGGDADYSWTNIPCTLVQAAIVSGTLATEGRAFPMN